MAISFIASYFVYILAVAALSFAIYLVLKWKKNKEAMKLVKYGKISELEATETIEYKMKKLLTLSGNYDTSPKARQAYVNKRELNLQDYWNKYIDLRAKLALNNISTHREESVLHLMCDELLSRMDNNDIEIIQAVKKEFIEENLTPLLQDVIEIIEGISTKDTINIDAYQLLKNSKEPAPIYRMSE